MKNAYLIAIVGSILILSGVAFVYAHNTDPVKTVNGNNYYSEEYMDQMHDAMVQTIDDPELVSEMNEMHEKCMENIYG